MENNKTLFIRVDSELKRELKKMQKRRAEKMKRRGMFVSLSGLVRSILWEAIENDTEKES
jgi:hypothetical protein